MVKKRKPVPSRDPKMPRKAEEIPATEAVKFVLRLSPRLHKKIKKLSKAKNQSMNKYIEAGLNDVVAEDKYTLAELFKRLEAKKVI